MPNKLTNLANKLDKVAAILTSKKKKKSDKKGKSCKYTSDSNGRYKWVCGPGGQPGDSETHSSQDTPGGSPDSGGSVGDAGGVGAAGGDGGGGGG